jgi:hypothetical protein
MAARPRRDAKAAEKLLAVLDVMHLDEVHESAWEALCEANGMPEMSDFNVAIDHITEHDFHQLAMHLSSANSFFWDRLAVGSSMFSAASSSRKQAFQHSHALVAVLAQAVASSSFKIAAASGTAYLALLESNGARSLWGTLVQPVLFHWLAKLFKPLCSLFKECLVVGHDESEPEDSLMDDDPIDEVPEASKVKAAHQLLSLLVAFLQSSASSLAPSITATLMDRLTLLMSYPHDEDVAKLAASALSAIIAARGSVF